MLARVSAYLSRVELRWRATLGPDVVVLGRIWVRGDGRAIVGARTILDGRAVPIELNCAAGAVLQLGEDVIVEGGASIEARRSVTIGARSRVRAYAKVIDNHFHLVRGDRLVEPESTPVVIEEDVELGRRSIILPGAYVGRGATVAPAAVVTRRVPPGAFARGVPAVIRSA